MTQEERDRGEGPFIAASKHTVLIFQEFPDVFPSGDRTTREEGPHTEGAPTLPAMGQWDQGMGNVVKVAALLHPGQGFPPRFAQLLSSG
jgi:hypothetical protein